MRIVLFALTVLITSHASATDFTPKNAKITIEATPGNEFLLLLTDQTTGCQYFVVKETYIASGSVAITPVSAPAQKLPCPQLNKKVLSYQTPPS